MQNQSGNLEAIKREFYETLNKQRGQYKKRSLFKHALGELAVTDLLMSGISKCDSAFQQTISQYTICSTGNIDYMYYDHDQNPKGYQHQPDEIKQAYFKALDDMINGPYKTKLLTGLTHTHVSFGMMQEGPKGEKFKIAAIGFKMPLTVLGIFYCSSSQEPGFILGGKMIDQTKKPMIVVINRGTQNQICLGSSRIAMNVESGEFRVQIPEFLQGATVSQMLFQNQEYNKIEIFLTSSQDNSFVYGQGNDIPINFNQFNGLELGFNDIIADMKEVQEIKSTLSQTFVQDNLFENSNNIKSKSGPVQPPASIAQPTNQIRMTKTQLMRQQQAAQIKQQTQATQQPQQTMNSAQNCNQTPHFNRSQTFTIGANKNLTPNFNNNANNFNTQQQPQRLNFAIANTNFNASNENNNPNRGFQFQFNSNQPSNGPSLMKFNTQAPQSFGNNGFKNPSQVSNNQFQGSNMQGSQNSGFTQPQPPKFQINFQTNQQTQQQPQPQFQIKFNQQPQQNGFQPVQNIKLATQQTQFNFAQQSQVQTPVFRLNTQVQNQSQQMNQFQNQHQYQTPPPQPQQPMVFSQLSLIDQETLKGYLKEISEVLSQEQIQKITALMLTDPMQFYKYYQTAQEQFQQSKQLLGSKSAASLPSFQAPNNNQNVKDESKSKRLREFDDITLFLSQLPSKMFKNNEVKFQISLQQIREGMMEPRQLLKDLIIRKTNPVNESFRGLHESKNHSDLLLILGANEFYCHQIVFASSSSYFKRAIENSKQINKFQFGLDESSSAKLVCPSWMDIVAVKNFIYFMYTGQVKSEKQMSTSQVIDLLKVANNFFHQYLQEYIISTIIIPNMTPASAVQYLKLCTSSKKQTHLQQSSLCAWEFLKLYSYFYLQKHLPSLLRTNSQLLYDLDLVVMREVIDKSFLYIMDGSKDLETILQFAAETWADKSISKFFMKVQKTLDSCSAFDYQVIPQMPEFFKGRDTTIDYRCKLIQSEHQNLQKSGSNLIKPQDEAVINNKLDSTFIQGIKDPIDDMKAEKNLSAWKPSTNVLPDDINSQVLFESKEPQFTTQISFDQIKCDFEANKGASVISRAFDFGRRSWHLKIDFDYDGNISLWIIERGKPLNQQGSEHTQIGQSVPIKFSSVIFQFELVDAAFGEHKSLVFFSFAHDCNQIIGHQNFINLNQLKEKNEIILKLHMKEFILHSALVHHISNNFGQLYQRDLKQIDLIKKNFQVNKNNIFGNDVQVCKDYETLSLPFFTVYQLFSSNDIRVDDENQLLGYVFYYTKIQGLQFKQADIGYISDLLSQSLRFSYLSTKKIMSALRDNEVLRSSKIFMIRVLEEFNARVQPATSLTLSVGSNSKQQLPKAVARKFYDMSKVSSQGRKKVEVDAATGKIQNPFIEDLIQWFQNSKHIKEDDSLLLQEAQKYKSLYYEEKSKLAALEQAHYYTQRQLSAQKKQLEGRRSRSHGKVYETQNANQAQANSKVPNFLRGRSPAKKDVPLINNRFANLQNNQVGFMDPRMNVGGAYARNNSFDQSRYVQDHRRFLNDSVFADQRVKANLNADFSQILGALDQSEALYRRNDMQSQPIAYYRKAQMQRAGQSNNNECKIF